MSSSSRRKLGHFSKTHKLELPLSEEADNRSESPFSIASTTKSTSPSNEEAPFSRANTPLEEVDSNCDDGLESREEVIYSGFTQLINDSLKVNLIDSGLHFSIDLDTLKNVDDGLDFTCLKNKSGGVRDKFEVVRIDGYFGKIRNLLSKLMKDPPLDAIANSAAYAVFIESLVELVPNASDNQAKHFSVTAELHDNHVEIIVSDDGTGILDKKIDSAIQEKILATKQMWKQIRENNTEIKETTEDHDGINNLSSLSSPKKDDINKAGGAGLGLFTMIDKLYRLQGELTVHNKKHGHGLIIHFSSGLSQKTAIEEKQSNSIKPSPRS